MESDFRIRICTPGSVHLLGCISKLSFCWWVHKLITLSRMHTEGPQPTNVASHYILQMNCKSFKYVEVWVSSSHNFESTCIDSGELKHSQWRTWFIHLKKHFYIFHWTFAVLSQAWADSALRQNSCFKCCNTYLFPFFIIPAYSYFSLIATNRWRPKK